jgi:DNA segregation ATPase FtsK/SpoIIIE, S-DNA-T family
MAVKKKSGTEFNHRNEVVGILLQLISVLILLSLTTYDPMEEPMISDDVVLRNFMGIFGVYVSHYLIKMTIGWGAFAIPIIIGLTGYWLFTRKEIQKLIRICLYIFGLGIWIGIAIETPIFIGSGEPLTNSSMLGYLFAKFIYDFTGTIGTFLILSVSFILLITGLFRWSLYDFLKKIWDRLSFEFKRLTAAFGFWLKKKRQDMAMRRLEKKKKKEDEEIQPEINKEPPQQLKINELDVEDKQVIDDERTLPKKSDEQAQQEQIPVFLQKKQPAEPKEELEEILDFDDAESNDEENESIQIEDMDEVVEGNLDALKERQARYRQYKLPSVDFLKSPPDIYNPQSDDILRERADQLKHALETFNVDGKVLRISPGPVITLFEVEPGEGIRVSKFTNLSDDLARIMKAKRVRIIAPIPGSKTVGIELPNEKSTTVYLKNIINSEKYINHDSKLTIAIGKTTTGDAYVIDIAKMPHMLIAGATGSGKSVCINTVIVSILYKAKPDQVKFIMIDPKKLELSTYKALSDYHLITSPDLDEHVMTNPDNAVAILNSALIEMDRRYTLFAESTVRNIKEYHDKRELNPDMENVPYIVVIIDELADLMMTAGKNIEEPITRLAQMARAVGIHLIVATQRPSVDVITGLIKANFPARIAFQVSQKVDSRTIIDQSGAEKLLGKGDMLFLPPGASSPVRLHNAFVTLDEIEKVMEHISGQPKPEEKLLPNAGTKSSISDFVVDENRDELLWDAAKLVIDHEQASVSLLQRRFRIGYSRAGRLIDELEALGIISGYSGSKARDVLVDEAYLENLMS